MRLTFDNALSIADLRELSRRCLPRFVFEFIDGGAEDEITLAANRSAFERVALMPGVLNDVSVPDLSTPLFGRHSSAPLMIAPMGSCTLARPGADLSIAKAAAARGIPYVQSTMSTTALETIARNVDGRLWFQLYTLRDREFSRKLIERVRGADFEALVVTVDLAAGGKRERDLRNGIAIPLKPRLSHVLDALRHPGWAMRYARNGSPQFENVRDLDPGEGAGLTIAHKVGKMLDTAFSFDDLARLLLNPELSDAELRTRIYAAIGQDALEQALVNVTGLVRPPDDVFYQELQRKQETVKRFLPTLLRVIRFEANPAAGPLIQALTG